MKKLTRIAVAVLAVVSLGTAAAMAQPTPICNTTALTIPSSGAASVYPTDIAVAALTGVVTDVDVQINGLNHTWPDDLDILLVAPGGQNLMLMSDAGGSTDLVNVNLVFDDGAAGQLPDSSAISSGTYLPTNYEPGDNLPAPAPATSAATALSAFNGIDPNGTWSLYVADDTGGDTGSLANGWCLVITSGTIQQPPAIDVSPLSLAATQAPDTTTQQALTIANTGEADLVWTIGEENTTFAAPVPGGTSPERLGTPAPVQRSAKELANLIDAALADVVQDGSFEAATPNPFWTEASTNFGTPLCDIAGCGTGTGTGPLTGGWWAWFGGIAAFEAASVSQSVTIPVGGAATLSFWVEQFVCSGAAADYLEVNIDGTQIWQTTAADPACGVLGYRQITLDVSAYADGGAHTLEFNSEVFGSATTNFFVDDVTLEAGPCQQAVDIPWLSVAPANGSTAGGANTAVTATFDSTGLAPGTYTGNLCVESNDPDAGPGNGTDLVVVPVQLTVEDSGPVPSVLEIPTLGAAGAALLGLALAGLGLGALRRRRS
ncbi:MAG: hypothetical protein KJ058_09580 [Thermoanaerobaculia bacterium]|nr:hypothetical protein [Thermoanaerobaculia bacterium]